MFGDGAVQHEIGCKARATISLITRSGTLRASCQRTFSHGRAFCPYLAAVAWVRALLPPTRRCYRRGTAQAGKPMTVKEMAACRSNMADLFLIRLSCLFFKHPSHGLPQIAQEHVVDKPSQGQKLSRQHPNGAGCNIPFPPVVIML